MRERQRAPAGECPFAVAPLRPCRCVAEALTRGAVTRVRDGAGLVHFAVPLILDGRNLLNAEQMRDLGFEYYGTGIPAADTMHDPKVSPSAAIAG